MGGAQGQESDIEITAREIKKLKKELYDIIAHHSGQPFDKVNADSDRDYWMTAEEAKNLVSNFDESNYFRILDEVYNYTKQNLTTKVLANYIINKI